MRAFILAGGLGTRLHPLTYYIPKSLILISGRPIIEYIIEHLRGHSISEVVLCTTRAYSRDFKHYLANRDLGVRITYSIGSRRLETSGRLLAAKRYADDTFIVYYGDILTRLDLTDMIRFHRRKGAIATIALNAATPIDKGLACLDSDGRVTLFREKPVLEGFLVNMGLYVFEPAVIDYCRPERDIAAHTIPEMIDAGLPVFGYVVRQPFYDIGTFKSLEEVKKVFERER